MTVLMTPECVVEIPFYDYEKVGEDSIHQEAAMRAANLSYALGQNACSTSLCTGGLFTEEQLHLVRVYNVDRFSEPTV
jgi:hypothetical protein